MIWSGNRYCTDCLLPVMAFNVRIRKVIPEPHDKKHTGLFKLLQAILFHHNPLDGSMEVLLNYLSYRLYHDDDDDNVYITYYTNQENVYKKHCFSDYIFYIILLKIFAHFKIMLTMLNCDYLLHFKQNTSSIMYHTYFYVPYILSNRKEKDVVRVW